VEVPRAASAGGEARAVAKVRAAARADAKVRAAARAVARAAGDLFSNNIDPK